MGAALVERGPMSEPQTPFTRRLRELIARESQIDVARRLGYTSSRISQVARGEKPSREFVERLVAEYGLDREEWLSLAGHGGRNSAEDERDEIARRAAEETVRRMLEYRESEALSGADHLLAGFRALQLKYPEGDLPFPPVPSGGVRNLTVEAADQALRKLEADVRRELGLPPLPEE